MATPPAPEGMPQTSLHVQRAIGGDADSLGWIVRRLSPVLLAQADYRMGRYLRSRCEPEDLVSEAWLIALPRLSGLPVADRRATPVLLQFLSTTILNLVRNLARKHARAPAAAAERLEHAPAEQSGVVTRAIRGELHDEVRARIQELSAADREVLVLRGIEGLPAAAIAGLLGISADAVSKRYQRALARLRAQLAGSVLDEMDDG
jgi:RNA polymerase sigma factor (sigma-70 family)